MVPLYNEGRSSVFQATWNDTNRHLEIKAPVLTTAQKVYKIVYNILSVMIPVIGLIRLCGYLIQRAFLGFTLPAASIFFPKIFQETAERNFNQFWIDPIANDYARAREASNLRAHFTPELHTVKTPDGALLDVILIRHKNAREDTPTILNFNGNGEFAKRNAVDGHASFLMNNSIDKGQPCNFVFFDYRGVADSKGKFQRGDDLITDGSSILQWVREEIQTPDDQIHFLGYSLGGAVALQTQALDADSLTGCNVNINSFSSVQKMIKAMFGSGFLARLIERLNGEGLKNSNPGAAFQILKAKNPQNLLVLYHPDDQMIPPSAGLFQEADEDQTLPLIPLEGNGLYVFNKNNAVADFINYAEYSQAYHHTAPLEWHQNAVERVTQFVFQRIRLQAEQQAAV